MKQGKSIHKGTALQCPLVMEVKRGIRRSPQEGGCKYLPPKGSPQEREFSPRTGIQKSQVQGPWVIPQEINPTYTNDFTDLWDGGLNRAGKGLLCQRIELGTEARYRYVISTLF